MVCRSTPGNSAVTTIARNASNLHDVQVLSLFHEVRSEAPRTTEPPTEHERIAFCMSMEEQARGFDAMPERRRRDLINRTREAWTTDVDGRTYYAWRNIEERAIFARAAMDSHFETIAARHNCTRAEAEAAFNEMMHRDHRVNGDVPQAPENVPFATTHLPRDRGTRYALAMLHASGPNVAFDASRLSDTYGRIHNDSEHIAHNPHLNPANNCPDCGQFAGASHVCAPTSALHDLLIPNRDAAANVAVNAAALLDDQATVAAANEAHALTDDDALAAWEAELTEQRRSDLRDAVRAEVVDDRAVDETIDFSSAQLTEDADFGGWLATDRARFSDWSDAVLYQSRLDRNAAAAPTAGPVAQNCPQCGQFAGEGHTCDPATAASALAPWEAEILNGPLTDTDTDTDAAATPTPAVAVRRRNPMRNYPVGDGHANVRMMNISALRSIEPNTPEQVDDIRVTFTQNPDGTPGTATVTGAVTVVNTGLRRTRARDRYNVTATNDRSLRCTCPDYQTNYDCEHVRQAAEHVAALINQRDPVAIAPAAAMESVAADLRTEYDASLAAAQEARAEYDASANESWSENMASFQTAWDEAKAHFDSGETKLPYMYENATNGLGAREGGRSIGIEIEVDFPDDMTYTAKQRVAREIYEAGLSDSPDVRPWHWRARQVGPRGQSYGGGYTDNPNMWSVEFDRTVDDVGGNRGCEIVSPILYDTPETWRNLEKICEIVERNGGRVTPRTGLHINIGAADFDHTVGNHNRLIGLANAYEDVIVRTAHNPQSGPQHRGRDYCRPMTLPENGFTSIRQAQRSIDPQNYEGSSHRAMINLDHVPAEGAPIVNSTRVEVRIFDGSIDPGRIQANVKMSLGMVNAAVRGVDVPRDHERAGTHRTRNTGSNGRMRRLRGEDWENDTATFRQFADTIFTRPEDKKQLTYAFAASRWQRR